MITAKSVFFFHCLVAIISHIFAVLVPIGIINLLLLNNTLDFWSKSVVLGAVFFSAMYGVNHVGNSEGFCVLTHVENFYRKKEGLTQVPTRFVPRFYKFVKTRKYL
jgi:hypothetical protein